jgi:hypothetical protein
VDNNALYGSTTDVDICGDGYISYPNLHFLRKSTANLSNINAPNPLPVPPPTE